jgi:predicted transcriptional regulator
LKYFNNEINIQPMTRGRQTHVVRSDQQLAALTSAARQEIVDVLAQMGTVSVAEVAATLGRPADALYYHLRVLKRVGLLLHAGYQRRGGRREELFRAVAPEVRLSYEPRSKDNRRAVTAIVGSMLRLGIRDFRSTFQSGDAIVSGAKRELWALRRTGWLSLAQIAGVNQAIQRLSVEVAKPKGPGRLYGITILLTPLDHRGRKSRVGISRKERLK